MKKYKETLRRAARTFFQAAAGCVAAHLAAAAAGFADGTRTLRSVIFTLAASAAAAGIAAVMNLPRDPGEAGENFPDKTENDEQEDDSYNG